MANFHPCKQHFSTDLTHDVESPSIVVNDRVPADEATGNTHTGGSRTLSKSMQVGFVLVALSLAITVGIALGRSSQSSKQNHRLQNDASRIIGGIEAQILRYQYTVSIQDSSGDHCCGGSLIAPDIILTAAHCHGYASVVIGRHNLSSSEGESIPIKMETPHAEYNSNTTDNDLMLVLLEWPTTMDLPFVRLNADADSPRVGESVTSMGWGDMTIDSITAIYPDVLMSVDITVISNEACANSSGMVISQEKREDGAILTKIYNSTYNGNITDNMLCAADIAQDTCQGDSGSPLILQGSNGDGTDDVLVGVVSWGEGCGLPDFPGVYARISQSYAWISNVVCSQSTNPPADFVCGTISIVPSPMPTEDGEVNDTISDDAYSMSMSYSMSMAVDGFDTLGGDGKIDTDAYLATDGLYYLDDYVYV